VDLRGPGGRQIPDFHAHHYPLNGTYRTDEWRTGELLRDPVEIVVRDVVPTNVEFEASLTILQSDRRNPVPFVRDGQQETLVPLGRVRVVD
jgi:hypothetical protein